VSERNTINCESGHQPVGERREPRRAAFLTAALGCGIGAACTLPLALTDPSIHNPIVLLVLICPLAAVTGVVLGIVGLAVENGPEVTNRGLGLLGMLLSALAGMLWLAAFLSSAYQ